MNYFARVLTDLAPLAGPVRRIVARTAVNKHSPQQICPQGVSVAFVGGDKQIGHAYAERGSGSLGLGLGFGAAPAVCWDVEGIGLLLAAVEELESAKSSGEDEGTAGGIVFFDDDGSPSAGPPPLLLDSLS